MLDVRFQPMQKRPSAQPGRPYYVRAAFKAKHKMDELERELSLLKATDIVIESGHDRMQIRNDGWPRGGSSPAHQDVRLYFKCKHGTLRYECNRFDKWEDNLRAIGLWLQRQRLAIEEWGIGSGGEAYRGFAALPQATSTAEWADPDAALRWLRDIGGTASCDLREAYQSAARKAHPDAGGSNELMAKVNRAKEFIEARVVAA